MALTAAVPARAADDAARSGDDIVVTATKRDETLREVPVSVAVTSAETIARAHIVDLIDLQSVVPSLKVQQFNAVGQTNFLIRGFGNGNGNDGIESSVGVFVDGVYRTRTSAAIDDLPEVERIEVLRGPQSTLFGKNVSAGAISIVTRRPDFAWGGKAELSVGNYGLMQGKASLNAPLGRTAAIRLSGAVDERDGYIHGVTTGQDINDRHRVSVRGDLLWQPTADFALRVIGDYNRIAELCCGVTSVRNGPATEVIGAPAPFGLGKPISDATDIFARTSASNSDPTNRLIGKGVSAQADYTLGFAKLTAITAYRDQINQSRQDVDFTGADIVTNAAANHIKTFTQELRLASNGTGRLRWLIGGFYQDEHVDTGRDIRFGRDARAFADALSGGAVGQLETLQSLVNPAITPGRAYFQPSQGISDRYTLAQRAFSLFADADFKLTGRLKIGGGISYMNDRKAARSFVTLQDPFSALDLGNVRELALLPLAILNPAAPAGATIPVSLFSPLTALQFFYANAPGHAPVNFPNARESGVLRGDQVTYSARLAYDLGPVNTYVTYATGWKAGAINLSSDSRPPDQAGIGRTAAPENVTLYEAGVKAAFRGGYANLAVFKQTIKGFQSNIFKGFGYALVNAGRESVKGFEFDAAYAPVKMLSLAGSVTYLDANYDSFTGAACVRYDPVRCPIDPSTGLTPLFRDLTGQRPAGIAEWSASGSATLSHDLAPGIGGYLRAEYDYMSPTYQTESSPPDVATWGYHILNASLGVTLAAAKLEVMLWARNLTDDRAIVSTFPTVAQDGSYSGYVQQPRTYGATVRKAF
ncbi:TonB-dependent receptor [Sphingomonas sp. H39-1-10]|uniref:TonB-dependent receptor n=1 Tax=Sphingomonas pollutisoli TaxID=3030829 RepID=UPI0023B9DC97|nr:TonB-dependent receptor [Sphingomonas pollutisoli]MDF0489494.1 TonB-dependent receptor [Sphingomonas pollutisoli]